MLRRDDIYEHIATPYEVLISKEDYEGNIPAALSDLADFGGKDVIDLGAGTGRLTCMAAPLARSILAVDFAAGMLQATAQKLTRMGLSNWRTAVADYRQVPAQDGSADIVMAGWTVAYVASSNHAEWEDNLHQVIREIERLLRPGGTAILLETLGTGHEEPTPPDYLVSYYQALEKQYGFRHKSIRTDYRFDSPEQAEAICRDFFGDELADRIRENHTCIVPECTGIWWRGRDAGQ